MSIVFILPNIPDPRINKRINVAKQISDTSVICVRRKSQNIWEPYHKDVNHIIFDMDLPASSHIFKRFFMSHSFHKLACKELQKIHPEIIYADGFDALCIAFQYKRKYKMLKIIYEIADIREGFIEKSKSVFNQVINSILKYNEKIRVKKINCLILTSMKFYDAYYKKIIDKEKVLFIPNTPDLSLFENYHKKTSGEFTVGFIGGIRYINQMKMLVDAAEIADVKVLFAGAGGTDNDYMDIKRYCNEKSYVEFTGKYDYAKEIAKLYSRVNCVYAVYDASNANVRIALPNKLYESVICGLPIIVSKETYLSELVESWGVGVAVEYDNTEELANEMNHLKNNNNYYNSIVENCHFHKKNINLNLFNKKLEYLFTRLLES